MLLYARSCIPRMHTFMHKLYFINVLLGNRKKFFYIYVSCDKTRTIIHIRLYNYASNSQNLLIPYVYSHEFYDM